MLFVGGLYVLSHQFLHTDMFVTFNIRSYAWNLKTFEYVFSSLSGAVESHQLWILSSAFSYLKPDCFVSLVVFLSP